MSGTYLADSAIDQAMEAVIGLMNAAQSMAVVTRGALPTHQGITCELGPSSPRHMHMDKNTVVPLDVVLNGKHSNLMILSDAMNTIHAALTRATSYPSAEKWEIVDIKTYTLPERIGREDNNDWLMASALSVEFYWRG